MPEIKQYVATDPGPQPSERGVVALTQEARRIGGLYNQAGEDAGQAIGNLGKQIGDYLTNKEVSNGAAKFADIMQTTTRAWKDMVTDPNNDPNDPTLPAKFREEVFDPAMKNFTDGFTTYKGGEWARDRIKSFGDHMATKQMADMSNMAAIGAEKNVVSVINDLSTMARNDPTSVDAALDMAEKSIKGIAASSPSLTPEHYATITEKLLQKAKVEILKAHFVGKAELNPNAAAAELDAAVASGKYKGLINSQEMTQLMRYARQQQTNALTDERRQKILQDQQQQDISDKTTLGYEQKLDEEPGSVTTKQIWADSRLSLQDRRYLSAKVNREMKPESDAKISRATMSDIMERMTLDPTDPRAITDLQPIRDAYVKGPLTKADYEFAKREFLEGQTPEGQRISVMKRDFFNGIRPQIDKSNPLMGSVDQSGKEQFFKYQSAVSSKLNELRKAGKPWMNAFTPGNPDYVGNPEFMAPFKRSLADSAKQAADSYRNGVPTTNLTDPKNTITGIQYENRAPAPPEILKDNPGAVWSEKEQSFVVQQNGKWYKVPSGPRVPTSK